MFSFLFVFLFKESTSQCMVVLTAPRVSNDLLEFSANFRLICNKNVSLDIQSITAASVHSPLLPHQYARLLLCLFSFNRVTLSLWSGDRDYVNYLKIQKQTKKTTTTSRLGHRLSCSCVSNFSEWDSTVCFFRGCGLSVHCTDVYDVSCTATLKKEHIALFQGYCYS